MTGYPGAPPYGGQYGNAPYPFPPNFAFHNMIPPPPSSQFGHQQTSFPPPNQFAPGTQMQYGNSMAYQNNAQYQQQLGQTQYPQAQVSPFYNPYVPTNMPPPYGNVYNTASFVETAPAQQTQNAASRSQVGAVFNVPVTDPRNSNRGQAEVSGASSPFQNTKENSLAALQQQGYPPQSSFHHADASTVVETQDRDNDNLAISEHSEIDLNIAQNELALAVPNGLEAGVKSAMDGAEDFYSDSEKSFDPYSVTDSQTPNAAADTPVVPSPKPKEISTLTLPGLEPAVIEPMQSELEMAHEQKKTLAIQAIQDLASRQIGFEQISKEDIDLKLLKDLYIESGVPLVLPTDASSKAPEPSTKPKATSPTTRASEFIKSLTEAKKSAPTASVSKKAALAQPDIPTITAVPNFNLPIIAMTSNDSPKPINQMSVTVKPNGISTTIKDPKESATSSANANRQDYLAKLQAAKEAVKVKPTQPISPASAPVADRSDYLARLQAAKEAVKQGSVAKPSSPQVVTAVQRDNNITPTVDTVSAPRSENNSTPTRASIDALLRQKLEALRRTQLATTSSAPTASVSPAPPMSPAAQAPQIVATGYSSDTQRNPMSTAKSDIAQAAPSSAPYFAPGITGSLPGLPGLPGLISELPSATLISAEQNQAPSPLQNSVGDTRRIDTLLPIYTVPSSVYTEQTSNQQALSENKQARKRPVATDFTDSPPTKVPRLSAQTPNSFTVDSAEPETEHPLYSQTNGLGQQAKPFEQIGGHGLPPRPEFPIRGNSYQSSQYEINPNLQAKEDEIRQLRQRIAQATLRKTGKPATETSADSKSVTASHPAAPSLAPEIEQAQRLQKQDTAIKNGTKELTLQEKALAAAKLQAQKHLEQIRRQQSSLNAQATKTQHETDHASSDAEREQKLQRKANLEAKLTSIDAIILTTEADLAHMKQEQDRLLNRIQQENEARLALMDEIQGLLQDLEKAPTVADPTTIIGEADTTPVQSEMDDTPLKVFPADEQDIEARPYPTHTNFERAVDPRVAISLLSSSNTSSTTSPQEYWESSDDVLDAAEDEGEERMDLDNDSVDMHEDEDEDEYDPETADITYEHSLEPEVRGATTRDFDDVQDDYEPAQEIKVLPVVSDTEQDLTMDEESSVVVTISSSNSTRESENIETQNDSDDGLGSPEPRQVSLQEAAESTVPVQSPVADHPDEGSNDTLRHEPAKGDDPDDEPAENLELTTSMDCASALQQHFVPYKSPLTYLKSYRFQPQFLETTAGGFRSLTYSHKIDPNIPFCKREVDGGVCGDPECDAQHFKDITLTDNNLLLQLGSTHEGVTQAEKEAYVAGLKTTIFAMRAKGLKDVNSIASEIAAYRRKFLDDPTRVIPNFDK